MNTVLALLSGLVFGLGLIASGMTDPAKVKGFLDLFGAWDPSLALVMGGAIAVGAAAVALARRRTLAWSGARIDMPASTLIDARLLWGGVIFGVGWGIAGFCPGPALVSLVSLSPSTLAFVGAMAASMAAYDRLSPSA